ncbi:transcription antitermination factor NusB [Bdellovibrionota bacterium]
MGKRRKSRELAVQHLFQDEINPNGSKMHLKDLLDSAIPEDVTDFYQELVSGVHQRIDDIDTEIEKHSNNWRISRMAKVDLNILRVATFELFYCNEIPASVTLNEAIEISKKFGSEDSPSFVNGVLDNILKHQKIPA